LEFSSHLVLLSSVAGAVAGGALVLAGARLWRRLVWRGRRRRAGRGERGARKLLRRLGYRVLEEQPTQPLRLLLDGQPVDYAVRADLLVRRRRRTYVAEVKTGEAAPDPATAATRRQLLEYAVAYPVDGVLLVDMEQGLVREVSWEGLRRSRPARSGPLLALLLGLLAGAALGALLAG
jgi:hypothetical protein